MIKKNTQAESGSLRELSQEELIDEIHDLQCVIKNQNQGMKVHINRYASMEKELTSKISYLERRLHDKTVGEVVALIFVVSLCLLQQFIG